MHVLSKFGFFAVALVVCTLAIWVGIPKRSTAATHTLLARVGLSSAGATIARRSTAGSIERVLHSFEGPLNGKGSAPYAGLVADTSGNFYGTTSGGGSTNCSGGCGTVFKLTPPAAGAATWTTAILYSFNAKNDGAKPVASLIVSRLGVLYGTTEFGGGSLNCKGGCGTVFRLVPPSPGRGRWTESILHAFTAANGDGAYPLANLLQDSTGALYGTASQGGAGIDPCKNGCGIAFKLVPPADGNMTWTETIIHSFTGPVDNRGNIGRTMPTASGDGSLPEAGFIADSHGNLYSTTNEGGTGGGAVYELSPPPHGQTAWRETTLYAFGENDNENDGVLPTAGVIMDGHGNLFGTTLRGGAPPQQAAGTVYELMPPANGQSSWTESILLVFPFNNGPGLPYAGLIIDRSGDLYGTTLYGAGSGKCSAATCGSVFELTPPAPGQTVWGENLLYNFTGMNGDGAFPYGTIISDRSGNIYGTTMAGGKTGSGTVFKVQH